MNLNQVTIPSTSMARSVSFYQLLGLKLIVRSESYARFIAGSSTMSLHLVPSLPQLSPETSTWIYFEVEDVDKTIAELEGEGVQVAERPEDKQWLWREARVRDPDGHTIIVYRAGENRENPPWRIKDEEEETEKRP